jgi:hypothetical protein
MKKAAWSFSSVGNISRPKVARSLTPDVTLAADALLVLIHYQNQGYAV